MNLKGLYSKLYQPFRTLYERETTPLGKKRLTLLFFCLLPVMLIGIISNFLGLTEPSAEFFMYTHSAILVVSVVILVLYCYRKISIAVCFATFTLLAQSVVSIEMIYCALNHTLYYSMLIMANMVLLALNMMLAMAGSMKMNTLVLGIITISVYIVCSFLSNDIWMKSFIVIFIIAFTFASLIGVWISKSYITIETENEEIKKEEQDILHVLRLTKEGVQAFVALSSKKHSHDGTKQLLDRLDEKSKLNLLANVEEYMKTRDTDLSIIEEVFPEFTPSEREICRLILQDKKLNDVCMILNKSMSNISSQRANMRKKLGLKTTDNLQKALQQRMDESK